MNTVSITDLYTLCVFLGCLALCYHSFLGKDRWTYIPRILNLATVLAAATKVGLSLTIAIALGLSPTGWREALPALTDALPATIVGAIATGLYPVIIHWPRNRQNPDILVGFKQTYSFFIALGKLIFQTPAIILPPLAGGIAVATLYILTEALVGLGNVRPTDALVPATLCGILLAFHRHSRRRPRRQNLRTTT